LVSESDLRQFEEARHQFARYLSDEIAPMIFADAAADLFRAPPELVALEIRGWIGIQLQGANPSEICDYLLHSAKKVYHLGELELLPKEELTGYLAKLTPILLGLCPERDRDELAANLGRIEASSEVIAAQIKVGRSPSARGSSGLSGGGVATGESVAAGGGAASVGHARRPPGEMGPLPDVPPPSDVAPADRAAETHDTGGPGGPAGSHIDRLNLLLDRWERIAPPSLPDSSVDTSPSDLSFSNRQSALVSRIVDEIASTAANATELDSQLRMLSDLGLGSVDRGVIRMLSSSLPDWAPVVSPGSETIDRPQSLTGPAETMRKVVDLSKNNEELRARFSELISAAVEEFNRGSLGRAVTVLDLAQRMIADKEVDVSIASNIIDRVGTELDESQLRNYVEDEDKHLLLRRVLTTYPPLQVETLLRDLSDETRRDRRRLIIRLLEIHGETARTEAQRVLSDSLSGNVPQPWFVQRNLIYLLRSIPAPDDGKIDKEIDLLIQASVPGGELQLVREALTSLGHIDHPRSVQTLAARVSELEDLLIEKGGVHTPTEIQSLLDTAVNALIRSNNHEARRFVVNHGLKKRTELGDTLARLAMLGGQDLSDDPTTVTRITKAIEDEFPMKVFGVRVKSSKRAKNIESLIESLSGTDTPQVRGALDGIVRRFPGERFSNAAARALTRLGKAASAGDTASQKGEVTTLSGDLALFGLPNLMQNLADSRVEGTLTVLDEAGNPTATIELLDGMMITASAGKLVNETALYHLLERPATGRFIFVNQPVETPSSGKRPHGATVMSLLMEGMRRYDEFNRAATIVPDGARFSATGMQPTGLPDENDADFVNGIWVKATQGVTPIEIERELGVDSYRVFRLFEHWINEGALEPKKWLQDSPETS
jgi:hypothetical protein